MLLINKDGRLLWIKSVVDVLKMKSMKLQLGLLFLLAIIVTSLKADPSFSAMEEEEKMTIISNEKFIEFFVNKRTGQLNARLEETKIYKSKSNLPIKIDLVVPIDENSKVRTIWRKQRKKTEIKPVIMDYEMDGIFHNDLKLCITEHKIDEKGGILEIGYEKIFTDTRFLNALYFKQECSVKNSRIEIKVPDWLDLNIEKLNFLKEDITAYTQQEKQNKIYVFNQSELPKFNKGKGVPSRQKIEPHLILIPRTYELKGNKKKVFRSLEDLYGWYHELVEKMNNEPTMLKSLVGELIQNKTTDEAKINAIYYWVQDNIRYIAFEDGINGFKPEDCQSVYQNRYGDCKGMANLTKEMLKIAGYDARLTWMGTRDIPYSYDMPSLMVDNHMICTVLLNGKKLYLDATQKYTGVEEYGYYIQEQEVLIEDGAKYIRAKIPLAEKGHYYTNSAQVLTVEKNQLKGSGKTTYNGSARIRLANYLTGIEAAKKEKFLTYYLSNDNKNVDITDIQIPDWTLRNQAIVLDYNLVLDNQVIDLGKELYLNVEIDYEFAHSDVEKDRTTPYEFSDKYLIDSSCEIQLPANVSIDYLPESVNISNEKYSFQLTYEKTANNTIYYQRKIELKETTLEIEDFQAWNTAIQQVKTFYEDQIILKKQ